MDWWLILKMYNTNSYLYLDNRGSSVTTSAKSFASATEGAAALTVKAAMLTGFVFYNDGDYRHRQRWHGLCDAPQLCAVAKPQWAVQRVGLHGKYCVCSLNNVN